MIYGEEYVSPGTKKNCHGGTEALKRKSVYYVCLNITGYTRVAQQLLSFFCASVTLWQNKVA
jgi:hypothetical protein